MTYSELYSQARELVGNQFEANQLFDHATTKKVVHLSFLGTRPAPEKTRSLLLSLCQRRQQGEPLQYLLGEWEFYGLPFRVGKGVLIPRQDTETLVDVALEKAADMVRPEILDLCSGSGCVAVAINHERPDAHVTALEVSDQAFAFLKQNIMINDSPVRPVLGDLMKYTHPKPLDLLVSNPPYIPRDVIATLQTEVRHEPRRALDGGVDGLDFYRAIVKLYRGHIRPGGWICLEVGVGQSDRVGSILEAQGFGDVDIRDDYNRVPRVVSARLGTG